MIQHSLEEFGLSYYESNAYLTLLSKGTISASDLAYYSSVPRTKIYHTLIKLEKKNLVILSKNKPIMCTSIKPEDAFADALNQQTNKINSMKNTITHLKKILEYNVLNKTEEKTYSHIYINKNLEPSLFKNIKSSLFAIIDNHGLQMLIKNKKQLITLMRKNIDIKIIIPYLLLGTTQLKTIPDGIKIHIHDLYSNYFIFDNSEILFINDDNNKYAVLQSEEILANNLTKTFDYLWNISLSVDTLSDLPQSIAKEIYTIIKIMNNKCLYHILHTSNLKNINIDMLSLLEQHNITLTNKTFSEIIDLFDIIIKITCSGHIDFNSSMHSITIESIHGEPILWTMLLDNYLKKSGYDTKIFYNINQNNKINIKIIKK